MAWIKVPQANHPLFLAALPKDARVETLQMFGAIAAKVNGHIFAGLFARSTMVWLAEPHRTEAMALDGATLFDPMGNGRARDDKILLPESVMTHPAELRRWVARAFKTAAALAPKPAKTASKGTSAKKTATKSTSTRRTPPKSGGKKSTAAKKSLGR